MDFFSHEADQRQISGHHLFFSLVGCLAHSKAAPFLLFLRCLHCAARPFSTFRRKKTCPLPFILTRALVISIKRSAITPNAFADGALDTSVTISWERATAWINWGSRGIQPKKSSDALKKRNADLDRASNRWTASSSPDTLFARIRNR